METYNYILNKLLEKYSSVEEVLKVEDGTIDARLIIKNKAKVTILMRKGLGVYVTIDDVYKYFKFINKYVLYVYIIYKLRGRV